MGNPLAGLLDSLDSTQLAGVGGLLAGVGPPTDPQRPAASGPRFSPATTAATGSSGQCRYRVDDDHARRCAASGRESPSVGNRLAAAWCYAFRHGPRRCGKSGHCPHASAPEYLRPGHDSRSGADDAVCHGWRPNRRSRRTIWNGSVWSRRRYTDARHQSAAQDAGLHGVALRSSRSGRRDPQARHSGR